MVCLRNAGTGAGLSRPDSTCGGLMARPAEPAVDAQQRHAKQPPHSRPRPPPSVPPPPRKHAPHCRHGRSRKRRLLAFGDINPIPHWFGFCPTATAFSGDLHHALTNSQRVVQRRKGGFGDCPLRSRFLFRRRHQPSIIDSPMRHVGALVAPGSDVTLRPSGARQLVDDLNLLWGRVCRASHVYPNAAKNREVRLYGSGFITH
jgi:hypothetical protein